MIRHYNHLKLKNPNPTQKLRIPNRLTVWNLAPFEIAQFSGELMNVMANAAQQYVYEKSLSAIKNEFKKELSHNENPS